MRKKNFGKTGKKISVLGFGGMRFDPSNEGLAIRAVQRAAELGINYFDTAPGYCEDKSEMYIGKGLASLPKQIQKKIHVSTKSHVLSDPTADAVRKRIEEQLKKLRRDKIEFYHMWCVLDWEQFEKIMAPGGPYEGAAKAKEERFIDHICISSHASEKDTTAMIKTKAFEGVTLSFNLMNHHYRKECLKVATEYECAIVTMNPLGGGMLTRDEKRLGVLKGDKSDSFVAAALRFNLSHREVTVVLSGMKNILEVEENVKTASSIKEPDDIEVKRLVKRFESLGESFCTGCGYCLDHCTEKIKIPLYASMWDRVRMKFPEEARRVYEFYLQDENRWLQGKRASDCTECGECEKVCTQRLFLREYMKSIAEFLGELQN